MPNGAVHFSIKLQYGVKMAVLIRTLQARYAKLHSVAMAKSLILGI